jgi:hypothetical protein
MKRKTTCRLLMLTFAVILSIPLMFGGCSAQNHEGFAIYLTKNDVPPSQMEALSYVEIAEQPIISIKDIITYNSRTHEIKLSDEAFGRIANLEVPVRGKSFLVCVDKAPVYWGAFWTPISSIAFDGVTIWKPLGISNTKIVTLELGYPSLSFYDGQDPRNKAEILKSLEQAGKLIGKLTITEVNILPDSMKGYELYSWEEDNQWHFTLITGTNRTRTIGEIFSHDYFISETGWVKVQVVGTDAVKDVFSRLPHGESIFWCGELCIEQADATDISLRLPPEKLVETIKECAVKFNLNLAIAAR